MARLPRVVVVGVPHHVTQRGNPRQVILAGDSDRTPYLALLREYAEVGPRELRATGGRCRSALLPDLCRNWGTSRLSPGFHFVCVSTLLGRERLLCLEEGMVVT